MCALSVGLFVFCPSSIGVGARLTVDTKRTHLKTRACLGGPLPHKADLQAADRVRCSNGDQ